MRKYCIDCTLKHLGSAAIQIEECLDGYPNFDIYVIGNLDQAAQEIRELSPEMGQIIRSHRVHWMENHYYKIPFEDLSAVLKMLPELYENLKRNDVDTATPLKNILGDSPYSAITEGLTKDPDGNVLHFFDTRF